MVKRSSYEYAAFFVGVLGVSFVIWALIMIFFG